MAVIAYEAEATIARVLDRLPATVAGAAPEVLVSDDASTDGTAPAARAWAERHPEVRLRVVRQDENLGYGGNQKAGLRWAMAEGLDAVALVHGDGQYPPEHLDALVAPIAEGRADGVSGSRMLDRGGARRGGMPLNRRIGNRALSGLQNLLTGTHLSEWHSGFRAYRVASLEEVGLDGLTDGFDLDTELTLRLLAGGGRMAEIAIPTHYGDEVSRIRTFRTGVRIIGHTLRFRRERRRARVRARARA